MSDTIDQAREELLAARAEVNRTYGPAMEELGRAESGNLLSNLASAVRPHSARLIHERAKEREKVAKRKFEALWMADAEAARAAFDEWAFPLLRSDLPLLRREIELLRELAEVRSRLLPHSQEIQGRMSAGGRLILPYSAPAYTTQAAADAAAARLAELEAYLAEHAPSPVQQAVNVADQVTAAGKKMKTRLAGA